MNYGLRQSHSPHTSFVHHYALSRSFPEVFTANFLAQTTSADLAYAVQLLLNDELSGKMPLPWLTGGIKLDPRRDYRDLDFILTYIAFTHVSYGMSGTMESLCAGE